MFANLASEDCYSLIKKYEGLRLDAYKCPGGIWTVGYGHTSNVDQHTSITEIEADIYLGVDVELIEKRLNGDLYVPLTQSMFDAICSFAFNVGTTAFANSTMYKYLSISDYASAADEFRRWVYAKGKKLPGLQRRRYEERDLFLKDKIDIEGEG